jgi:broad specificity phosphatase PhoE
MYRPAVFCNGHIKQGRHHGDAFAQLSLADKCSFDLLVSGHVNEDGSFTTEMKHLEKEIILLRHAESLYNINATDHLNSDLSNHGELQAHLVAEHLRSMDLTDYVGITSPLLRCLKTARYIQRKTGLRFHVREALGEVSWDFPPEGLFVHVLSEIFDEMHWDIHEEIFHFAKEEDAVFVQKLNQFFNQLPPKTILVTHGACVMTLIELALGAKVAKIPEWDGSIKNASLTHIKNGTMQYFSKVVY